MYFWRIENLKDRLATRPFSERETLPYLVVFVVLCTAVACIPQPIKNIWDVLEATWSILLAAAGTIYIYRKNGVAGGQNFLQRYLAVSWVVTIRWVVIFAVAAIAFYATLEAMGLPTETTHWYDFLFVAVAEVVVYWRIGFHIGDLAERTKPD
jgi:hypothetical protein